MTTATAWLGKPRGKLPTIDDLVVRYLAAFGPASAADVQTWSGLTRLGEVLERMKLLQLKSEGGSVQPDQVYFSPKLPTGIGGAVKLGDVVYGTASEVLVCFEFKNGDIKWQDHALGAASLCYADGRLYLHGENGQVALVEPSSAGYHEKGRFTPPDRPKRINDMEKAWAYPVVVDGKLFLRDQSVLWCYDVTAGH